MVMQERYRPCSRKGVRRVESVDSCALSLDSGKVIKDLIVADVLRMRLRSDLLYASIPFVSTIGGGEAKVSAARSARSGSQSHRLQATGSSQSKKTSNRVRIGPGKK